MTMLAVVTGAGSGIGRACSELLAHRGAHVIAVGRRPEPLRETVQALAHAGTAGTAVTADVATDDGVAAVVDAVGDQKLDAVIHAAGRESVTPFDATTRAEFEAVIATNLAGPFFLTQQLAAHLADAAGVVFVASMSAHSGRDRHAAYGASKAALIGLTKNLAVELAPGVRVNCLCPGATVTPMLQEFLATYYGPNPSEELAQTMAADAKRLLLGTRRRTPRDRRHRNPPRPRRHSHDRQHHHSRPRLHRAITPAREPLNLAKPPPARAVGGDRLRRR